MSYVFQATIYTGIFVNLTGQNSNIQTHRFSPSKNDSRQQRNDDVALEEKVIKQSVLTA